MSLTQYLHRGKRLHPTKPALIFEDRVTTYAELHDKVALWAGAYSRLGLPKGSRVCILSSNTDHSILAFLGAIWGGLLPIFMNCRWSIAELSDSVDDCSAALLVADDSFMETAVTVRERCPSIQAVVSIGVPEAAPHGVRHHAQLLRDSTPLPDSSTTAQAPAFLNYTGGTTRKGKGVVHSHGGFASSMAILLWEGYVVKGSTCLTVPLFHIAGISVLMSALMAGNSLSILPRFEPEQLLRTIQKHRIHQVFMVPTMLRMMLENPTFASHDLSSLGLVRYGGSPIDDALIRKLRSMLPHVELMQLYGQTEGIPISMLSHADHDDRAVATGRTQSAGLPVMGVDLAIRGPAGETLPANAVGEISLRGPHLMLEYWHDPEQTRTALRDGWLYTGDAGYLCEHGYLHIVDRIKDMIVSGGENIYSAEVENALNSHPAVLQSAVVGLPDERWGEIVHAEVVFKPGCTSTTGELDDHCRALIAGYKIPKSITFASELPLTSVGKLDKVSIREKYA
ncbi:Long-chain-fatty-acid--CoA ligase [compost metagenome]